MILNENDIFNQEGEANMFARKFFVNKTDFENFKSKSDYTVSSIVGFANEQSVSPGIIVSFLQHDKCIDHNTLNKLKKHFKLNQQTY